MKYFIDTHDKTKGSFPQGILTEQEFLDQFDTLEAAAEQFHVGAHAAHINLEAGKALVLVLLNRLRRPYRRGHLVWVTPPVCIHTTDNARHRFVISAFSATMASSSVEHSSVSRR